jgi:hypothetical protein
MQALSGRKKIMAQVMEELSTNQEITLIAYKLHGLGYRKKLVSREIIYKNFPLMRILFKYKRGGKTFVLSRLVYPASVYPYGRKSVDVLEDIAKMRYKEGVSWNGLGDIYYERYEFSLDSIKAAVKRVELVFSRLLTTGIVHKLGIAGWVCSERRSFITLSFTYRVRLFFVSFGFEFGGIDLFRK